MQMDCRLNDPTQLSVSNAPAARMTKRIGAKLSFPVALLRCAGCDEQGAPQSTDDLDRFAVCPRHEIDPTVHTLLDSQGSSSTCAA
jgi:hypothetical protein